MPQVGWYNPKDRGDIGMEELERSRDYAGRNPVPPAILRFARIKGEGDVRHSTLDITATRTLGCPRQVYIETQFPYHLAPAKVGLRIRGSMMHEIAAKYLDPDIWYSEDTERVKMTIAGTLGGYPVSAQADAIRRDLTEIADHKFGSDWGMRYRKDYAKDDHQVQLNIMRLLLAQQEWAITDGYDPDAVLLTIWDYMCGQVEGPKSLIARHMSEEEVLAYHPGGAEYTVSEIMQLLAWAKEQHETAGGDTEAGRQEIAASLPLVGVPMYNAKKCDMFCDVQHICSRLARSYGTPAVETKVQLGETVQEAAAVVSDVLAVEDAGGKPPKKLSIKQK